ncbi:efflux transporter periplasmic adaptor subunit, partial [Luteimonas sp. SJ-92]
MNVRTRFALAAAAAVLMTAGGMLGYWWAQPRTGADHASTSSPAAATADREVLYWYDPMAPDQRFDRPGKSPFMDMQLVPKYADDTGGDRPGIAVAAELRRTLGIRTVAVGRGRLEGALSVPGTIAWDLRREHVVSVPVDAVIQQLHVKAPFDTVRAGQPVA